jgi:hypothetical protein
MVEIFLSNDQRGNRVWKNVYLKAVNNQISTVSQGKNYFQGMRFIYSEKILANCYLLLKILKKIAYIFFKEINKRIWKLLMTYNHSRMENIPLQRIN